MSGISIQESPDPRIFAPTRGFSQLCTPFFLIQTKISKKRFIIKIYVWLSRVLYSLTPPALPEGTAYAE